MVVFPLLGAALAMSPQAYGEWCGLAIHATPQVIAAGFAHALDGETAGEIATIVKLTRISLLGPTVFVIGVLYTPRPPQTNHSCRAVGQLRRPRSYIRPALCGHGSVEDNGVFP